MKPRSKKVIWENLSMRSSSSTTAVVVPHTVVYAIIKSP